MMGIKSKRKVRRPHPTKGKVLGSRPGSLAFRLLQIARRAPGTSRADLANQLPDKAGRINVALERLRQRGEVDAGFATADSSPVVVVRRVRSTPSVAAPVTVAKRRRRSRSPGQLLLEQIAESARTVGVGETLRLLQTATTLLEVAAR